jgi:DNA-binding response OmpR family regulator
MAHRALYLTNDSQIDQEVFEVLSSLCEQVHVVSAIAQATALIESPSLASDLNASKLFIVADVSAGGIVLAEYVNNLFSNATQDLSRTIQAQNYARPIAILLDRVGDVTVARKALRLGVDGYILSSDTAQDKHDIIHRLLSRPLHATSQPTIHANANGAVGGSPIANNGANGHGSVGNGHGHYQSSDSYNMGDASGEGDSDTMAMTRLSQIESAIMNCLSEHIGLPLSARSIVHEVMGRDMDEEKAASLIRPHISRLRSKVEPTPQMPQRLLTVRGKGYMFVC